MSAKAFKGLSTHITSLTNTVSILLVGLVEVLVGKNVFQCPCEAGDMAALRDPHDPTLTVLPKRHYYSISFIIWPAIAAFFMALAVSENILRCLIEHRCCRHFDIRRQWRAFKFLTRKGPSVLVPSLAWLFIVFMDGRYYQCAVTKFPDDCLPAVSTLNASWAANHGILERENQWHRSLSQIMALTTIGCGAFLLGIATICGYICSDVSYYRRRYAQLYRQKEMEVYETVSEARLTTDLTAKWELFFKEASDEDWNAVADIPTGSTYLLDGQNYYSTFHAWKPGKPKNPTNGDIRAESVRENSRVAPV